MVNKNINNCSIHCFCFKDNNHIPNSVSAMRKQSTFSPTINSLAKYYEGKNPISAEKIKLNASASINMNKTYTMCIDCPTEFQVL